MPHTTHHFEDTPSGVERACQIARQLFNHARGNYDTDQQTVDAVARHARLSPATVRRFIQPSRRPKDVSLGVWGRLLGAYRRYLERELASLEDEIDRLRFLDPDDRAIQDLLHQAEALVSEIEAAAAPVPPRSE